LEVEGSEEMAFGVREWDGGGPSNKLGRVRGAIRSEELDGAEFHDAIERTEREAIPLWPPTTQRVAHGRVGRMLKQELDMIDAGSIGVDAVGIGIG
jgi:hypothetical protein